ncbi:MAG: helix-turn-helix transcriptional regulator [Lachnospiraceae bacterium]|nr:helix-turn-helix transcriptional regulator [Lachnospiraceae bacterium]
MEIKLGEKIRSLRKQKNISQEVLAQVLGVTFQAVSKWETGAAMPDVTMIPAIASFFEVSTDELFSFNLLELEEKVMKICSDAAEFRFSDPAKSEAMLREGLKQYPGNDIILNNLLYTMQSPDRSEEVITVCKSILEVTKEDDVKYDVLRILAKTYHEMGQQALVGPTLEEIPEIYFSKLELAAKYLEGKEALDAASTQAMLSRDDLLDMVSRMSQLYREQGNKEKAADYANLTRKIYALFEGRTDMFDYHRGRQQEWLSENMWPRLEE